MTHAADISLDAQKAAAARAALALVEPGMTLGLGTGSTAAHFIRLLGAEAAAGLAVRGVATSEATAALARAVGVPLLDPDATRTLDLAIDGADEVDPQLRLIKGGGGALLREKIVAAAARRFVVLVDSAKLTPNLGRFPLPVEVTPFGVQWTAARVRDALEQQGCPRQEVGLRQARAGGPFVTDGGNWILVCQCLAIPDPEGLARRLAELPGVVEHGLFLGMAERVLVGGAQGGMEIMHRPALTSPASTVQA
jgi:ribose 5-phosphate isomerase A